MGAKFSCVCTGIEVFLKPLTAWEEFTDLVESWKIGETQKGARFALSLSVRLGITNTQPHLT
jgi:hypothetical protein